MWLLISVVGSGAAGTIKVATHIDTDVYWAMASWVSSALAIWSLFLGNDENVRKVFEQMMVLEKLSTDIAEARRKAMNNGTEQEIADLSLELHARHSNAISILGAEHSNYAERYKRRITKKTEKVLLLEGLIKRPNLI